MNRRAAVLTLPCLVALNFVGSCSTQGRVRDTHFMPLGNGMFRYSVMADAGTAADSHEAEAERMAWLKAWLSGSGMCREGYQIMSRSVVLIDQPVVGPEHEIVYRGRCRRNVR